MDELRQRLKGARRIAVLTGAGISAESGIPTFRGQHGLWRDYRAEDLATPGAFARDPRTVWEWYDWRRVLIAQAQPNAGHRALAELEAQAATFTLITQNADDLHERAGSKNVLHVHGSIWAVRCTECERESADPRAPLPALPPRCDCGGLLRPGVVWFGETLHPGIWRQAEDAARQAEVFLVIGTSAVVYPAAGLARIAQAGGAELIEINVEATGVSRSAGTFLQGPAGQILPQLIA